MGATTKKGAGANFYQCKNQKFVRSVKEKTENAVEIEKDGKKYFQEEYNTISGEFSRFFVHEEESATGGNFKIFSIEMVDAGKKEIIEFYFDSKETETFLRRLPNINLEKPAEIVVRRVETDKINVKTGKKFINGRIDVYQPNEDGVMTLVPNFYTKEKPLPPYKETTFNGKKSWDKTDLYAKLESLINEANAKLGNVPGASDFEEVTNNPDNA